MLRQFERLVNFFSPSFPCAPDASPFLYFCFIFALFLFLGGRNSSEEASPRLRRHIRQIGFMCGHVVILVMPMSSATVGVFFLH